MANLNDSVNELNDLKSKLDEAAETTDDVKAGNSTPEEEKQEPEYVLLNEITNTTVEILQLPTFVEGFAVIENVIGPDATKKLAEMMAVAMTHSALSAIMFYDNHIAEQMKKQFDRYGEALNNTIATVNAITPVMEIYKRKISDLEKAMEINKIENE